MAPSARSEPGFAWFARHELRLAWRDASALLVRRGLRRRFGAAFGLALFAIVLHLLAYGLVGTAARDGIRPDHPTLVVATGFGLLSWCLMLSQAIESVTRAFYARGDLDLILSAPVRAEHVFAVRIAGIAAASSGMAMLLVSPVVNVLAVVDGPRWLAAYAVAALLGTLAAGLATLAVALLFRLIGPGRTRTVAQVVAAIVGAAFAILVQGAAILSYGDPSRLAILTSAPLLARAPSEASILYGPARAAMGDAADLAGLALVAATVLIVAVLVAAPRFRTIAREAAGLPSPSRRPAGLVRRPGVARAGRRSPAAILREKEWRLLARDPWLLSQTLMQILYLVPAALLLWRSFGDGADSLPVVVPVLVMAAGQLAGGLAWLAVSGEDAPDLVATAPVTPGLVLRAKVEAVLGAVGLVVAPLLVAVAVASPRVAALAAGGIAVSAMSATAIQLWFRSQARRSGFRRRQTSSRLATFAEAFSSILWACTAALAAQGAWPLGIATGLICCLILGGVRALSPRTAVA